MLQNLEKNIFARIVVGFLIIAGIYNIIVDLSVDHKKEAPTENIQVE